MDFSFKINENNKQNLTYYKLLFYNTINKKRSNGDTFPTSLFEFY